MAAAALYDRSWSEPPNAVVDKESTVAVSSVWSLLSSNYRSRVHVPPRDFLDMHGDNL